MVQLKVSNRKMWRVGSLLYVLYIVATMIMYCKLAGDNVPKGPSLPEISTEEPKIEGFLFSREPLLQPGCAVRFANYRMVFCHIGELYEAGPFIARKLLEYYFHCSSDSIPVVDIMNEDRDEAVCLWVGPSKHAQKHDYVWNTLPLDPSYANQSYATAAILAADVFQDYYWLPTPRINKPPHRTRGKRCLVDSTHEDKALSKQLAQEKGIDTARVTAGGEGLFGLLNELILCDMVESKGLIPLALADSLGIPNKAANETDETEYRNYLASTNRSLGDFDDRENLKPPSQEQRAVLSSTIVNAFPFHLFSASQPYVKKAPKDLETLVIIMGNIRGGEAAWSTFYKHMLDLNSADLALVIGRVPEKTSSLFQRAKYVYEFPEFEDWGQEVDNIHGSNWRPYILPFANDKWGTWGGVGDKAGSGAVIFMIRYFVAKFLEEKDLLRHYDRFVLTRSDHYYGCDHDLSLLDNDYMWVPRGEDYKFGITDRHLVCNKAQIMKALDIYPPILRHPEKYASPKFADMNPESLLRFRWEQERLWPWVRRFDRVMFTCATDTDTTRWTNKSQEKVKEGVFLKYEFEYEETTCICKMGPCNFPYTKRKMRVGYPQRDQKLV